MKNFGQKFALIGLLTALGLAAIWPPKERLKLGIDLSGGTILVYQTKEVKKEDFRMEDLIGALKKRVNPEGVLDIPIRQVGDDRVEIILPEATTEQVERVKRQMTAVGAMEFRILADRRDLEDQQPIERAMTARIDNPPSRYGWARLGETVVRTRPEGDKGPWEVRLEGDRLIDPSQEWPRDRYVGARVTLTPAGAAEGEGALTFPILSNDGTSLRLDPTRAITYVGNRERYRRVGSVQSEFPELGGYTVRLNPSRILSDPNLAIRTEDRGGGITEYYVLYKRDPARRTVTGEFLSKVYPTEDEQVQPAVGFAFNAEGARRFGALTAAHLPREDGNFMYHLAIVLDDLVMSAPVIRQEIRDSGIIEGMQPQQVEDLINILRAGSLPASIDPIPLQQEQIGPTLGKDTIEKGVRAIGISMLVVPIFMIIYYRFAGVVAVVALVLNMILLVGSMALVNASFTLPGLAGLALTIGMAVDANVLIFERMREEAERGANLGTQIRNGFSRAWSTILDSNVTTILSGLVLWFIGTEEVKGFATTLIMGLVWNLFTAVYVSHVIFDYWYAKGWLKRLTMMKIMGRTEINFTGPRRLFQVLSLVVIAIGLAWFAAQKGNNFNIDFTGGTLVTVRLDPESKGIAGLSESQRAAFVRDEATAAGLPDVSVESLNVQGEAKGTRFNIRTTEADAAKVQKAVRTEFGDALALLDVRVGKPEPIPAEPKQGAAATGATDKFAGGLRYRLTFNREVATDPVQVNLENILRGMNVASPEGKFELARPAATSAGTGPQKELVFRTSLDEATATKALDRLAEVLPDDPNLLFERLENFGAAVAADTQTLAGLAMVASWGVIIGYLWFRFKSVTYGLAAVLALVHDVFLTLGAVAISPYKIDLPMVAAFLTLIGFSVNDTIVIFDRIRELKGKTPYLTEDLVNSAVNQTLSRTILTSLTAWLVVVILYLFGGEGLQGFSFALVVGFLSGTYSTIYIAAPILIDWSPKAPAKKPSAKDTELAAR
jgi:SecD/SecF fusion protein